MRCEGAIRPEIETYTKYSWVDSEKQIKKVLGVFIIILLRNLFEGAIVFLFVQRGPYEQKFWYR